ncbi:methyl transferase [Thalassiosira pseudonana CCMP1335]|uniref:thiopurine S-methyltransferase n=1 Tax=Thalassiosira pseudonana TaxID=35128 RepID=B8C323_THAPS|nr:methyl transferase [Thalassiosira pseudonana CCMP1335]EED92485.1 methyl transferase [Thalassiosira pseudonana CCMP1335]
MPPLDDLHSFWSQRWSGPKLGWHLEHVNPHLSKYTDLFLRSVGDTDSDDQRRVFVPLCGKSVDLAHLAAHPKVSHVVGIDIMRDAAETFANEHPQFSMVELTLGDENDFHGEGITFLLGDLFDFKPSSDEGTNDVFDAIYDRASMVAIHPTLRKKYVSLLGSLLRPSGTILLVTIEKRQVINNEAKLNGPPFSIDEMQVRRLYEAEDWVESVTLLEEKSDADTDMDRERWAARGVVQAYELVFLIRKKV